MDTATEEKTEEKTVGNDVSIFNRKINKVLNRSRLRECASGFCVESTSSGIRLTFLLVSMTLLQDTIAKGDKWGNDGEGGRIDPFIEIYDVRTFSKTCTFLAIGDESFPCPARSRHDRPFDGMSRAGK